MKHCYNTHPQTVRPDRLLLLSNTMTTVDAPKIEELTAITPGPVTLHDLNTLQGIQPDWFATGAKAAIHYVLTVNKPATGAVAALVRDPFFSRTLPTAKRLQTYCFTDVDTGLTAQVQPDLICPDGLIVDLQPTPARSYRDFIKWLTDVQYYTSAAFQVDAVGASRLVCLGIQTVSPHRIYYFEADLCRGFIEQGRQQYKALLRTHIDHLTCRINQPTPVDCPNFIPLPT